MKTAYARMLSWLLVFALVLTMTVQTAGFCVSAEEWGVVEETAPTLDDSGFEDASFLTQDQYRGLGFSLGSAKASDQAVDVHPLMDSGDYTYQSVKYGWSNPQVIAVMLSSPYWDELQYGTDMTAAGGTTFSLSYGVETSESQQLDLALGLSIAVSSSSEVMGNGVELGAEIKATLSAAVQRQSTKATSSELEFSAGAGVDNVALVVYPVASYEYIYEQTGETVIVNVQLTPIAHVTPLAHYNSVAREHNVGQTDERRMMPVIHMPSIRPAYTTGDPSSAFSSEGPFPDCLVFRNGRLMAAGSGDGIVGTQVQGTTFPSGTICSVSAGTASTSMTSAVEFSESQGKSISMGIMLDVSVYGELSEGADLVVGEVSFKQRLTVSGALGATVSHATLDTSSVRFSMTFVDLPASAITGSTGQGISSSNYDFNGRLFVWVPSDLGDAGNVSVPMFIGADVGFADREALPPYLPDDLHVSKLTEDSVTLSWTNSVPSEDRSPCEYEIFSVLEGSESSFYEKLGTVSGESESYTVTGLSADMSYTFLLRSNDGSGIYSAYGPSVTVRLNSADGPVITKQPQDLDTSIGGRAEFSVGAQSSAEYPLSYQWYQLEREIYGTSWTLIPEATDSTFNAAYYEDEGTVETASRYDLDGTVYRCVVTENRGGSVVSTVSDAAVLTVEPTFYIDSYEDLVDLALQIRNGDRGYASYDYVLTCDIACPSDQSWTVPIGTAAVPFTGTFDGQGHTISGLHGDVTTESCFGLFGVLSYATVKDLRLEDIDISGDDAYVGGLCGKAQHSVISGCSVSGAVALGAPESSYSAGGVCGRNDGSVIQKCVNYSSVWIQATAAGGVCGQNGGTVVDCANHGSLDIRCPYLDNMPTSAYGGGIVGYNSGTVENCYNTGTLICTDNVNGMTDPLCNRVDAVGSYYLNSITNAYGGRTSAQFASGQVAWELNGGVTDGSQVWYQAIDNGGTADAYPTLDGDGTNTVYETYLTDKPYSNQESALDRLLARDDEGRYIIEDYQDLQYMAQLVATGADKFCGGSYVIVADITCDEEAWPGIGTDTIRFEGTLDGQGHTVADLNYYDMTTALGSLKGLFTVLGEGAVVEDIIISHAYIYDSNGAGAIARENAGTIRRCLVVGETMINVTGSGGLGGIAGVNDGIITDCGNVGLALIRRAKVDGTFPQGGITQINNGTVRNCYSYRLIFDNMDGHAGPLIATGNAPENSYYHYNPGWDSDLLIMTYGTVVEQAAFDSGEITYLLNGDQSAISWKQTIGTVGYPTFTGETVYLVADCLGQTVYSNTDVDLDHQLGDDDICDLCGYDATPAAITPQYPSLSFEDEIVYNLYFTVQGVDVALEDIGLLSWSSRMEDGTYETAEQIFPGAYLNGELYMVHTDGVPAKNMGDDVYFKIYARLSDGSYLYSDMVGYNAKLYARSILDSADSTEQMKAVVVSLLSYGAEAQLYFDYGTDALMDEGLTDQERALVEGYDESMVDPLVESDSAKLGIFQRDDANFKSLYPSVSFDGAFSINFYCIPAIAVDSGMTLYWWDMEDYNSITEFTVDNATGSMEMIVSGTGHYWGNVPGIAAKEIDKTWFVACVFQSGGETVTTGIIPYSLGRYCEGKAAIDGDAQQAFAQATAVYGYCAKQYFASIA